MIKLFKCRGNAVFGYQLVLVKNNSIRINFNNNKVVFNKNRAVTSKDLRQARNEIILARKITKQPKYFYQKRLVKKISCSR